MKYRPDLEPRTIPTYEKLKNGLLGLIEQGKISREDAAMLLPELREGEDERIRKWIIEEFKIHYDFESPSLNPMVEKAIDWLEKQKEKERIIPERELTDFEIEVHEIISQARNDKRLADTDLLKQFEEEAAFALMLKANKLIEQKPKWSDEDETNVNYICDIVDAARDNGICDTKTAWDLRSWLKSLRPQEEEDKK